MRSRLLIGVAVLVAVQAPPLTAAGAAAAVARELIPAASDEFNGSALDTAKWRKGIWYKVSGNEQDGGAFRPENVTVSGGNLVISAKTEDFGGRHHTYGAVESLFEVPGDNTYVEVRAKLLDSRANVLSAIWMQSSPLSVANNPNPEIDIHESFSSRRMVSTLHRWVKSATKEEHFGDGDERVDFGIADNSTGFHTYGLRRQYGILTFFQDGRPGWTVTPNDPAYSSLARHMVLSLEGHLITPNEQYLPATFQIDYVRSYRETFNAVPADNRVKSWLKSDPVAGGGSACKEEEILLSRGHYAWRAYAEPNDTSAEQSHMVRGYREIDLDAGTYIWTECVKQENGFYSQSSTLKRKDSSLPAAQLAGPGFRLTTGQAVTFGSTLRWMTKR